jgi:hypothetical protein
MKAANESLVVVDKAKMVKTTTVSPLQSEMTTIMTTENGTSSPTILPAMGEGRSSLTETTTNASKPPVAIKITMIERINSTAFIIGLQSSATEVESLQNLTLIAQSSLDLGTWTDRVFKASDAFQLSPSDGEIVLSELQAGKEYFFKVKLGERESNIVSGYTSSDLSMEAEAEEDDYSSLEGMSQQGASREVMSSVEDTSVGEASGEAIPCSYKNDTFAPGEQMYNGCEELCVCHTGGRMKCIPIDCPHDGGMILDESCIHWEVDPKFRREAPNCCPPMKCGKHSSCELEGVIYRNFEDIPQNITGCDKSCSCEYGNVTCRNLCPPMTQQPPIELPCPPHIARAVQMPQNECCYHWICPVLPGQQILPLPDDSTSKFPEF